MSLIGIHLNFKYDELEIEAKKIYDNGGNMVQIFVSASSKKAYEYYKKFNGFLKFHIMKCAVHASYTINLSKDWNNHSWWIKQFVLELNSAHLVGASYIVVHIGKQLELSLDQAINNMYTSLLEVVNQLSKDNNVKILIETCAGQGSEILKNISDLGLFYKKLKNHKNKHISEKFGICLDTCHVFSAGNDIRGKDNIHKFMKLVQEHIGIEEIKMIHLNDSKTDIGSGIDRHANIGDGFIGKESLLIIAKLFIKLGVPIMLETPDDKIMNDLKILIREQIND